MLLNEFIRSCLGEIQRGVKAAIDDALRDKIPGAINPVWGTTADINAAHLREVSFDIAITVAEKSKDGAEASISVVGFKLGGGGGSETESTHVSRIQFSIPIIPPVTTVNKSASDA